MRLELERSVRRSFAPWAKAAYTAPFVVFWGAIGYDALGVGLCAAIVIPGCALIAWQVWRVRETWRRARCVDTLVEEGRYREALKGLQEAPPEWPDEPVQVLRGYCHARLGDGSAAALVLTECERAYGMTGRVKVLHDLLWQDRTPAAPAPIAPGSRPELPPPPDFARYFLRRLAIPALAVTLLAAVLFVMWSFMGRPMRVVGLIGLVGLVLPLVATCCYLFFPLARACARVQQLGRQGQWQLAAAEIRAPDSVMARETREFTLKPVAAALLVYCYECQGQRTWADGLMDEMERKWPSEYVTEEMRRWLERARQATGGEGDED